MSRNPTFYFPSKEIKGESWWTLLMCNLFLLSRGYDWRRFRVEFDGQQYRAEEQGGEQHER